MVGILALLLAECGGESAVDGGRDGGTEAAADLGTDAPPDPCLGFVVPARPDTSRCDDVDVAHPDVLATCLLGSGYAGAWTVDADGLPAYDFALEERCDPAARAYSPRSYPLRDPIHGIGNGRGLVAMAHASGGVEIYSQDRGHAWRNAVDTWADPANPTFTPQLGGGFVYVLRDGAVLSTRFEDLPIATATAMQSRRFGVGYVETKTDLGGGLRVDHRVLAPDATARALVSELILHNDASAPITVGLVELWDPNLHEVPVELLTSDVLSPGISEGIDRRRRLLDASFTDTADWNATTRIATVTTTANTTPTVGRLDPSEKDWFPDPLYLAVLDDAIPDGVWLDDREGLNWVTGGNSITRTLTIPGAGQHTLLAIRVPVTVPAHGSVTRRFAFGYVPGGGAPDADVAELRRRGSSIARDTSLGWHDRLIWASIPGAPNAGAVQRELAWSTYAMLALATYDEYHQTRVLGQGGSYKYIHGLDGAIGDLAIFADALDLVDPALARDTLRYALATQHAGSDATPWRFPYATTGVGTFSDVGIYDQRSDAYWLVPSAVARYVALSRDDAFLDAVVPYWPHDSGESGAVTAHLGRALDYATTTLGLGARGIVAMGTNDYADGVLSLATEPATPTGTSSVYNAGFIVNGFPLAADVVTSRDAALAARFGTLAASQRTAFTSDAWLGSWYARGFVDSGNPLAPSLLFVEPQALAILAGIPDDTRRDALLDLITAHMETPIGALSTVAIDPTMPGGGPDQPQIGGVWPVANAWVTEAHARRDVNEGWDSFVRNTLFTHAVAYPAVWYGIWTGPDSFFGPDATRPGEADAHDATALTDYPALNVHVHTSPIRALMGLLGVRGTAAGIAIAPRLPTSTYDIRFPRLRIASTPTSIEVDYTPSADGPVELRVVPPAAGITHAMVDGTSVTPTFVGAELVFSAHGSAGIPLRALVN